MLDEMTAELATLDGHTQWRSNKVALVAKTCRLAMRLLMVRLGTRSRRLETHSQIQASVCAATGTTADRLSGICVTGSVCGRPVATPQQTHLSFSKALLYALLNSPTLEASVRKPLTILAEGQTPLEIRSLNRTGLRMTSRVL